MDIPSHQLFAALLRYTVGRYQQGQGKRALFFITQYFPSQGAEKALEAALVPRADLETRSLLQY
jgi:hypothetical protein